MLAEARKRLLRKIAVLDSAELKALDEFLDKIILKGAEKPNDGK